MKYLTNIRYIRKNPLDDLMLIRDYRRFRKPAVAYRNTINTKFWPGYITQPDVFIYVTIPNKQ